MVMLNLISQSQEAAKTSLKVSLMAVMVSLAACGGGGSDGYYGGGTTTPTPTTPPTPTPTPTGTPKVINIQQNAANLSLNSGGDSIGLTIKVLDDKGGVLKDIPVELEILDLQKSGTSLGSASSLVTNEQGLVTTSLDLGTQGLNTKINHDVVLRVKAGTGSSQIVQDLTVPVVGSKLVLSSNAEILSEGQTAVVVARATDSKGIAIANAQVSLLDDSGKAIGTAQNTSSIGEATFNIPVSQVNAAPSGKLNLKAQVSSGNPSNFVQASTNQINLVSQSLDKTVTFTTATDTKVDADSTANIEVVVTASTQAELAANNVTFATSIGEFANNAVTQSVSLVDIKQVSGVWVGTAKAKLTADRAGIATVSATYRKRAVSANIRFVAVTPAVIIAQSESAVLAPNSTTTVTAVVRDKDNAPVENVLVTFALYGDATGSLSAPTAITNSAGEASIIYKAGAITTNSAQVKIKASTGSARPPVPHYSADLTLTVSKIAAFITVAQNHLIEKVANDAGQTVFYSKAFSATVTDSVGNPIARQAVSVSLRPTGFKKGYFKYNFATLVTPAYWEQIVTATCPTASYQFPGAFLSASGQVVSQGAQTFTTDDKGNFDFSLRYGANYAAWFDSTINAATKVSGVNNITALAFIAPAAADDFDIEGKVLPPNYRSPYGVGTSCSDYN